MLRAPPPQAFVAQWATLHPLATAARRRELRPLQMLTELGETVALLQDSSRPLLQKASGGGYELGTSVQALIDLWGHRVPSATHQDVSVWDDLLCCRKRLLATLEKKLEDDLGDRVFEETEQDAVRTRFGEADSALFGRARSGGAAPSLDELQRRHKKLTREHAQADRSLRASGAFVTLAELEAALQEAADAVDAHDKLERYCKNTHAEIERGM